MYLIIEVCVIRNTHVLDNRSLCKKKYTPVTWNDNSPIVDTLLWLGHHNLEGFSWFAE